MVSQGWNSKTIAETTSYIAGIPAAQRQRSLSMSSCPPIQRLPAAAQSCWRTLPTARAPPADLGLCVARSPRDGRLIGAVLLRRSYRGVRHMPDTTAWLLDLALDPALDLSVVHPAVPPVCYSRISAGASRLTPVSSEESPQRHRTTSRKAEIARSLGSPKAFHPAVRQVAPSQGRCPILPVERPQDGSRAGNAENLLT